jgi:heptaprenylglyceryl phosphate synthase
MLEDYKKRSISPKQAAKLSEEELTDRIVVGELVDIDKPEMLEEVKKMKNRARGGVE